ncbi:Tex family protein [Desulfovibrio cuneatus]|uniref:Tex family protein n=1 Tax=Desulfovibrio cuneatus TaxID=159728 RepID=UPI000A04FF58|nr:Tex family protein [Desulfovibrio cuneatus]
MNDFSTIAQELAIAPQQCAAVAALLDEGATIPFIARYRKEAHGSLDEVVITAVRDRLSQLRQLAERKTAIRASLEERGLLSAELEAAVQGASTMALLEDIYLPYRPKRRTRAMMAREKGLEPLALALLEQQAGMQPAEAAQAFVDAEKGVASVEEALAGARDIIAELVNENAEARTAMRELFLRKALFASTVTKAKEEEGAKFRDYFQWEEPAAQAAGHRVLAMLRGENEGFLTLKVQPEPELALNALCSQFCRNSSPAGQEVRAAVEDGYKRLLAPAMETELRNTLREKAEKEAIGVFARNLRGLLLDSPLGQKRVLALDPGFRTGCKVACLDAQGKLLHHDVVYILSDNQRAEATSKLQALASRFGAEAIAIGNGTASRESEALARGLGLSIPIVVVSESGASVYSASETARKEFPDLDLTVRGAISIGRRLMDPLAELVKIDPKAIGVGQYQHDVDQTTLKQSLTDVVESCVNAVGVDVNTASALLLAHVSGLGPSLATNIVAYRDANGPFRQRKDLLKVPRLGPKAFEQAAGFLRIRGGENPLDASAVHPESYPVVQRMAKNLGCTPSDLVQQEETRRKLRPEEYVDDRFGLPTITDILKELEKPGRDPRAAFSAFAFNEAVTTMQDLQPGMRLPGIVTNVTNFGAFVDIGVHQDGLVHISQLADQYVSDPHTVVAVRQEVFVTVLEVDAPRKRISLTMRTGEGAAPRGEAGGQQDRARQPERPRRPEQHGQPQRKGDQGKGHARPPQGGRDESRKNSQQRPEQSGGGGFNNPFASLKRG